LQREALVAARSAAWRFFKIVSIGMTLAAFVNRPFLRTLPGRDLSAFALPIPPGLLLTALPALLALAVLLLSPPSPPSPGLVLTTLAAVASPAIFRDKESLAPLQEATAATRSSLP
jgi:hypothetical protein